MTNRKVFFVAMPSVSSYKYLLVQKTWSILHVCPEYIRKAVCEGASERRGRLLRCYRMLPYFSTWQFTVHHLLGGQDKEVGLPEVVSRLLHVEHPVLDSVREIHRLEAASHSSWTNQTKQSSLSTNLRTIMNTTQPLILLLQDFTIKRVVAV